jgi:L-threonylcarbamoyladenylate synthase
MRIIKINYKKPNPAIIKKAAGIIKNGGIVVVPTQTVYGILGNGLNEKTVGKLLKLKKRNKDKGFDLTLYPLKRVFKYVESNPLVSKILEKFPEQPLSFALPRKERLPGFLNPGFKTVAFHFFFSKLDEELFKYINTPLIGTSANISRLPATHSVGKVAEYFRHTFGFSIEPDLMLDAGELSVRRRPSAIIELAGESFRVIREGDISRKTMEKKLEKIKREMSSVE